MNVIFCIPGKDFSTNWVKSWTDTIVAMNQNNINWGLSMTYDPVVYYVRNKILGGQNTSGKNQKPWQGGIDYDKMIWIDSDMVWKADDVLKLLSHDKPIVSGTYLMSDATHYPIVEQLDYNHLAENGTFKFISKTEMTSKNTLFESNYAGFGFLAIQEGVVESMEYPWFQPRWVSNENFHDFCAEDVGFCWQANDLGYKIWIDPTIKVGHEKSIIL